MERSRPTLFKTLEDIVRGSVISAAVYSSSLAEISRKFDQTIVVLDTNFLLSVFEFHFDSVNRTARELMRLMNQHPALQLRVFDFTVDEMVNVLASYARRGSRYSPRIRVDSIFSSLRNKGWTSADGASSS